MGTYQGLNTNLRAVVMVRDHHRCRWCGRTNVGVEIHHIRYRRGSSDDVEANLICLCRQCHNFVHGALNGAGEAIRKTVAQDILWSLVEMPGATGLGVWRNRKHQGRLGIGDDAGAAGLQHHDRGRTDR